MKIINKYASGRDVFGIAENSFGKTNMTESCISFLCCYFAAVSCLYNMKELLANKSSFDNERNMKKALPHKRSGGKIIIENEPTKTLIHRNLC